MAGAGAPSAWGPSPALVTALVALLGLGLAAYIVGPQLYWHAAEALTAAGACPACDCNCDARPLLDLPEGPCRCRPRCFLRSWPRRSFRSEAMRFPFRVVRFVVVCTASSAGRSSELLSDFARPKTFCD